MYNQHCYSINYKLPLYVSEWYMQQGLASQTNNQARWESTSRPLHYKENLRTQFDASVRKIDIAVSLMAKLL